MRYDHMIVGAGPSGLTLAHQLMEGGRSVVVVDRDDREGGLAKSFTHNGNVYDIGPKRFHTDDPVAGAHIHAILGEDQLEIGRSSLVYFMDRYFDWPLTRKSVLRLPIAISLKCFVDLLRRPPVRDRKSFREYIHNKYGATLYRIFFQPYTEKFLRTDAEEIHADWASTGINRSIIDEKAKGNTLLEVLRSLTLPPTLSTRFIYPSKEGFGFFCAKLRRLCEQSGQVAFRFNTAIDEIVRTPTGLELALNGGERLQGSKLVWTGNLNDLLGLIQPEREFRLKYLNTVLYVVFVQAHTVNHDRTAQWIYISDGGSLLSRVSCPRAFADYTCGEGSYVLVCEVTDSQADPKYFIEPEKYQDAVIDELVRVGLLKDRSGVSEVVIHPIKDTYPIYHRGYLDDFNAARRSAKRFSKNLVLVGRSGSFWYNNSDHTMRQAIETAKYLLKNEEREFAHREYFGGVSTSG